MAKNTKRKFEGFILPEKTCYEATQIKTVWYCRKYNEINQREKIRKHFHKYLIIR